MDEPLFLRDPFIMDHSIKDNNPEGVRVTGVRGFGPTEGRTNGGRKEGVGGVGSVTGVPKAVPQTKTLSEERVPFWFPNNQQ